MTNLTTKQKTIRELIPSWDNNEQPKYGSVSSTQAPTNTPTSPTETVSDLEHKILVKIGQCKQPVGYSCEYCSALHDVLAILRQPSEHDLELIKEGHQRSDRDTRRGV